MRSWLGPFGSAGPTELEFTHDLTEYDALVRAERKACYFCERCGAAIILDERVPA